jgi:AraC-like DNA-binding protein
MANWKEEWKPIEGFPGYKVSNKGKVWSQKSFRNLTPLTPSTGPIITLCREGVVIRKRIDTLVAQHFLPPQTDEETHLVMHKDGDPFNNNYTNLRWCPEGEHMEHWKDLNTRRKRGPKVSPEDLQHLLAYRIDGASMEEIARQFGISASYASRLCRNNLDKHKARGINGNVLVRYWYAGEEPPERWYDDSVPIVRKNG